MDRKEQIASDNIKDRKKSHGTEIELQKKIHKEDQRQVADLRKDLKDHCEQNLTRDKLIDERDAKTEKKIDKLLPLVDLIPAIQIIVEDQKAATIMGRKILKWIGYASAALGLLWLILQFWKELSPHK